MTGERLYPWEIMGAAFYEWLIVLASESTMQAGAISERSDT